MIYKKNALFLPKIINSHTYIGETKRNVEVRWLEHEQLKGKSEPAKHLNKNPTHKFSWRVLMSAPQNTRVRKKS